MEFPKITLPLFFTLLRLIIAPIAMPLICVNFLFSEHSITHYSVGLIFLFFTFTDFLDGYLARKYNQTSVLGKLLDPLADKMLMFSTMIALVYLQKMYYFWAVLFIGREFYIMGLREIALYYRFTVDVQYSGKAKTALQSLYIITALLNLASPIETLLLIIALFLTFYSAYEYTQIFTNKWKQL